MLKTLDAAPRTLSHAERCRTLLAGARTATLSTHARDPAGHPYGSLVAIACDARGRPLLLLSKLAEHTMNLLARPESSVLVSEVLAGGELRGGPADVDPLALGRATVLGETRRIDDDGERSEARATFLARQPRASAYVDFADFGFFRLEPRALRYVGGFGRMSWVSAEDYATAEPDPLAPHATGILSHMNEDHADAVLAYATALAGIEGAVSASLTSVDRYGFTLDAITTDGTRSARLGFDAPVTTTDEVRRAMVALVRRARRPPGQGDASSA